MQTKKVFIAVATILVSSFSTSFSKENNCNTLFQQVQKFAFEKPQQANLIVDKLKAIADSTKSSDCKVFYFLAKSETLQFLSLTDKALTVVDSAYKISTSKNNKPLILETLLQKSHIQFNAGNFTGSMETLNNCFRLATKYKLSDYQVRTLLAQSELNRKIGKQKEAERLKLLALESAKKYHLPKLEASCHAAIGSAYWQNGYFNEALENYYKSLIIREDQFDTTGMLNSLKNIGLTYRELGQFNKSLSSLNKALNLASAIDDKLERASILNLIGSLYFKFKQYNLALDYYNQSLDISESEEYIKQAQTTRANIARIYTFRKQYNLALDNLKIALDHQEKLNDPETEALLLTEMGNLNLKRGNISEALRRYLLALKIRQVYGKSEDVAKALLNIGLTYRKSGMLNNAQKYLEQARNEISNFDPNPNDAAYILQTLGNIYTDKNLYGKAIAAYNKALQYKGKSGDKIGTVKIRINIAQAYLKAGNTQKARLYITQAIKSINNTGIKAELAELYNELGNVDRKANKPTQAIANFKKAIEFYNEKADSSGTALCLRKIGEILLTQGNYAEAEKDIEESIKIGKKVKNPHLELYGNLALKDLFELKKDFEKALKHHERYTFIKDSLDNAIKSEANIEAQIDLELDKTKSEIKLIETEVESLRQKSELDKARIEKQKITRNLLIIISLLVLLLAGVMLYNLIQKRKHNKLLQDKILEINQINDKLTKSESDLIQALKTRDKLFSIIAHDLRSPFTALVGLTEIMSSKISELSINDIKEFSIHIHKSAMDLLSLIENLLGWARAQSGKIEISPKEVNINDLMEKVVEISSLPASAKDIIIEKNIDKNIVIFVDYNTTQTIFRNLLSNAIKFTPEKGKITISAFQNDGWAEITVTDTGIGIDPKNLNKLFKLDGFTTKGTNQENGTGLGLILCKEFVEKNGGNISVKSRPNIGTTFTVQLPISKK
ncbi:MAG: tetratricopeptide repeat-containing sensor histidine kinase [Bacteroidales bacterium]|nr:tetratricopeptide repeat-containing sensor histidine kinase [Bacteroidales bacterium]HPD96195.1 tetratricopeptide repeat-containing sensor histidine kinase [Tenuifilaceae bacterium]